MSKRLLLFFYLSRPTFASVERFSPVESQHSSSSFTVQKSPLEYTRTLMMMMHSGLNYKVSESSNSWSCQLRLLDLKDIHVCMTDHVFQFGNLYFIIVFVM